MSRSRRPSWVPGAAVLGSNPAPGALGLLGELLGKALGEVFGVAVVAPGERVDEEGLQLTGGAQEAQGGPRIARRRRRREQARLAVLLRPDLRRLVHEVEHRLDHA